LELLIFETSIDLSSSSSDLDYLVEAHVEEVSEEEGNSLKWHLCCSFSNSVSMTLVRVEELLKMMIEVLMVSVVSVGSLKFRLPYESTELTRLPQMGIWAHLMCL